MSEISPVRPADQPKPPPPPPDQPGQSSWGDQQQANRKAAIADAMQANQKTEAAKSADTGQRSGTPADAGKPAGGDKNPNQPSSWGDRSEASRRAAIAEKHNSQPPERVSGPVLTGDALRNEMNKQFANNPQMPRGATFIDGPGPRGAAGDAKAGRSTGTDQAQPARPEANPAGRDTPTGAAAGKDFGNWDKVKLAAELLLGPQTTRFVGGMIDKATGVVQDTATAVKDIYGRDGMLQKAGEKMADKAAGIQRPDEYYCSKEDSDRYLKAIVTIGATTMPEIPMPELKIPPGGVGFENRLATAGGELGARAGHGPGNPEALFRKARQAEDRAGARVGPDGVYQTTKNLAKGNAGERLATESLAADGHTVLAYKPDIIGTNRGGIDMVTTKDGKLYLIDNKAFQAPGNVRNVSSLTTNLKQNVDAIKDQFTQFAADQSRPAVERKMYTEAVTQLTNGDYVKVVTNASMTAADGQMKTAVSKALGDQGIKFVDVYPGKKTGPLWP